MRNAFSTCLILVAAMASNSIAQPPDGETGRSSRRGSFSGFLRMLPVMSALDADGDGTISAAEIENASAALKALDKNEDGSLTEEELRPDTSRFRREGTRAFGERPDAGGRFGPRGGPRGRREPSDRIRQLVDRLIGMDSDGDGKLTVDEVPERVRRLIEVADTNKDGFATREELTETASSRLREPRSSGDRPRRERTDGEPSRRSDAEAGGDRSNRYSAMVDRIMRNDKNGDGRVDADELPEAMRAVMRRFDTNEDGAIDEAEIKAVVDRLRGRTSGRSGGRTTDRGNSESADEEQPRGDRGNSRSVYVDRVMRNDKNGDGKVSEDELPESMRRVFSRLDANGDGGIDRSEVESMFGGPRRDRPRRESPSRPADGGDRPARSSTVDRILRNDKDGDGKLSKEELPEAMHATFDRIDGNDDGFIDRDEISAFVNRFNRRREESNSRRENDDNDSANENSGGENAEQKDRPARPPADDEDEAAAAPRQPAGARANRRGPSVAEAPAVGESLPDVAMYNDEGTTISLQDLRGSYSVLVFGCLT